MIIIKRFIRLLLLAAVLASSMAPCSLLYAQENKVDLSLRLLSGYYYQQVAPGESTALFMEIRNNGNTVITDIKLNTNKPKGWAVKIVPASISRLSAGSSQTIDINIIPAADSPNGEYTVIVTADATETSAAVYTTLKVKSNSRFWLWIGLGIAALVAAIFATIFLRSGKQ